MGNDQDIPQDELEDPIYGDLHHQHFLVLHPEYRQGSQTYENESVS